MNTNEIQYSERANPDQSRQAHFVRELSEKVVEEIVENIFDGKIPAEWDGIELRQLLADRFAASVFKQTLTGKRKRDYLNTVLVNDL